MQCYGGDTVGKNKRVNEKSRQPFGIAGRGERIRTSGPYVPNVVLLGH